MSSEELHLSDPAPTPPPDRRPPMSTAPLPKLKRPSDFDYGFPTPSFTFLLLLALTAVGGYLRFWRLGQQSYWCDEAATLERICDSYEHLVAALRTQAFPPGWYVALQHWLHIMQWWTGSASEAFMPQYMRLLPALCGTLTVPAMYLLARQFMDRRGALLVMLLAAVNPFLIYYSRDIKMYSALYFLVTLHTALFFKWLSVENRPAWLEVWVGLMLGLIGGFLGDYFWGPGIGIAVGVGAAVVGAFLPALAERTGLPADKVDEVFLRYVVLWPLVAVSGTIMLSLHNIAWFIVGLELVWLLTHRNLRALTVPLWAASVGMMAYLPIWWQLNRSTYLDRALNNMEGTAGIRRITEGSPDLGLTWITRYTDMSWHTIIGLPTTHLTGFLWPEDPVTDRMKDWFDLGSTYHTLPWLEQAQWYVGVGLLLILFVGLLPWHIFEFSGALWRQRIARSLWLKILLLLPVLIAVLVILMVKVWAIHAWPGMVIAAALLMAPGFYWRGFNRPSQAPAATRGRAWWIAIWILVPVSVFALTWLDDNDALEIRAYPAVATIPPAPAGPATVTGTFVSFTSPLLTIQTKSGPAVYNTTTTNSLTISGRAGSFFSLRTGMQVVVISNPPWKIPFTSWYLHHNTFWGNLTLTRVWEPRYLGIVVPAFLLWLAFSLRRLPTWPLRAVVITAVVGVCTLSSLSNNLVYRQAPFGQTAELVKKYIDPNRKDSVAFGTPAVEFAANAAQFPFILDLGGKILPQTNANRAADPSQYASILPALSQFDEHILDASNEVPRQLQVPRGGVLETNRQFLQRQAVKPQVQTIILTDRLAGTPNDPLTDAAAQKFLGDNWVLTETLYDNWYYEWRFYIYHTWRTRVWVRKPATAR